MTQCIGIVFEFIRKFNDAIRFRFCQVADGLFGMYDTIGFKRSVRPQAVSQVSTVAMAVSTRVANV